MSWFDATGIASLAKTALKEAQKTIDKALDINEDGDVDDGPVDGNTRASKAGDDVDASGIGEKSMNIISNPILATVGSAGAANNIWGSFTGTFFDKTATDESAATAVTIAPSSSTNISNTTLQCNTETKLSDSNRTIDDDATVIIKQASATTKSETIDTNSVQASSMYSIFRFDCSYY